MRDEALAIRRATPADAGQISRLYIAAYASVESGEKSRYPFPQFFDREWVAQAVSLETIYWVVAECDSEVIATVGAVRNIGAEEDRIAEGFGLVVDPKFRGRGIAHELFRFLTVLLVTDASFIIGEARTANPGGWRVLRACGFVPIGFEPFAHVTPAGVESMLLTGLVSPHSSQRRVAGIQTTEQVRRLADAVLTTLNMPTNAVDASTYQDDRGYTEAFQLLEVVRDDDAGQRLLDTEPVSKRHASGVVGLDRLEGLEQQGSRFERQFHVARTDEGEVSCVRIAWDGLDRRARILDLRTRQSGVECEVLRGTHRLLSDSSGPAPISISIDVRSDAVALQTTLEELGFRATAYYPGLIASGETRIDAVQYTCCLRRSLSDGWQNVGTLDWQPALDVTTIVIGTSRKA
jgi:RimJ/RimL family protein N-acetyltransferase